MAERRGTWRWPATLALLATSALAAPALTERQQAEDFDAMWRAVDSGYAYFGSARAAWKRARNTWRPRAAAASRDGFVAALEGALAELCDDHVGLSERSPASPRAIPFETDIWARWKDGAAVVEAVRTFGDADVAGLRPGQAITRVDGVPVERAVREKLGAARSTPAARDWAVRQVLAGPRQGIHRLDVRDGNHAATLEIARAPPRAANGPAVIGRRMGDDRDIGYVRVRVGAGEEKLVEQFDAALHYLRDTRALILDLRENAGPGSRALTRAILARFAAAETPWQLREPRGGKRVADTVAPVEGAPYRGPIAVLVDRWTGGEGEALAAGLQAVAGARLIGTTMAGVRGELREVRLPHSGIAVRFPAEKAYQANGAPRESIRPAVAVDLAAPSGGPGDPILYQALKLFEKPSPAPGGRSARD